MDEEKDHDLPETEIKRGHDMKAALSAEQMTLPEEGIGDLERKAIGRMAAVYRNAHGAKQLARQYGLSKKEVERVLRHFGDEMKKKGDTKPLEPCYDYKTGKYLSFEEWLDHYLKIWDHIPP